MGYLLGILVLLLVVGLIASGIVYSRQQAILHRDKQIRALQQQHAEVLSLYEIMLRSDHEPHIVRTLNRSAQELAGRMRATDPSNPAHSQLVQHHATVAKALEDGSLKPRGERVLTTDASLRALLGSFVQVLQKLQRLKMQGVLAEHQYQEAGRHLKVLSLETEIESHLAFATRYEEDGDRLKTLNHLRHALKTLKGGNVELTGRTERIRDLSEHIKRLEKDREIEKSSGTG